MSTLSGNTFVDGSLSMKTLVPSAGCVSNTHIASGANVDPDKLRHRHKIHYSQQVGVDSISDAKVLFVCTAATGGSVRFFGAGAVTPAGAATTYTIDLKKNGTTILTATFVLDTAPAAYITEAPLGYTSTALADGDVLTIHIVLSGANEAQGLFALLEIDEYPD